MHEFVLPLILIILIALAATFYLYFGKSQKAGYPMKENVSEKSLGNETISEENLTEEVMENLTSELLNQTDVSPFLG